MSQESTDPQYFRRLAGAILGASVAVVVGLSSCSGDSKKAEDLYQQAEAAYADGNTTLATELIDSLDSAYPREVDVRRKAIHLRALTMESSLLKSIATTDSLAALEQLRGDSLERLIQKIDNPVEPYFVARTMAGKAVVGSDGVEARMMPDGTFYLISSIASRKPQHVAVAAVAPDGRSARTSQVAPDGERNDRSMGYEVIHYMPAESEAFARFVADNRNSRLKLVFEGSGSRAEIDFPEVMKQAVADVYDASQSVAARRRLVFEKNKQEKQLQAVRGQMARTFPESQE